MQSTLTMSKISNHEIEEENQEMSEFEQLLDEFTYQVPKRGQIKEGEIKYLDENSIILDVGLKRDAVVQSSEINQLENDFFENLSIGDILPVYVQRTPVGDEDLLVSIADALEYQNWKEAEKLKDEGDIVELKVTGMNKGGLLVRFDRIEGFVPNSHISGTRKFHSRGELTNVKQTMLGESLRVTPIEVDRENQRLVFSARAAESSIRDERLEEIKEGEVLTGKVVNLVKFGAFVDLGGVDGLVHLSELAWKRVKQPSEVIQIGDEVDVLVMNVDVERSRIQLSRKALIQGPWDRIEEEYVPGDLVEVKIVNVVDFGAFAQLPEGVHGLIHISELGYSPTTEPLKTVDPGDDVLVKILKIDRQRERVSLSMRKVPLEAQYDWSIAKEEAALNPEEEDVKILEPPEDAGNADEVSTQEGEIAKAGKIEAPEDLEVETSETEAAVPEIQPAETTGEEVEDILENEAVMGEEAEDVPLVETAVTADDSTQSEESAVEEDRSFQDMTEDDKAAESSQA